MATEWYYTTDKRQMGPVSWKDLVELAEGGILKPQDLVWTEGMDDWVKAINQKGLFADSSAEEGVSAGKKSSYSQPKPPPGRRTRRADDDEEEDEEDDREAKRKARKREEARAKTSVGIKVGLILAAVVFVLLSLACGGSVLLWLSLRGGGGGDGPRRETYTIFNLNQNGQNIKHFNFKKGQHVVITATNQLSRQDTDVDLRVFRGNDAMPFAFDDRLPHQDRNCRVEFAVPANDSYRVLVVNLGPGMANRCDVAIDVR
jgi:hypothetical protein